MNQRTARQVGLAISTLIMLMVASLPAQAATPKIIPAQRPDQGASSVAVRDHPVVKGLAAQSTTPQLPAVGLGTILEEEIVYIGDNERIYVLDTHQVGTNPLVKWVSPDGDWRSVDVGDFNNDGDMEIVAVGGDIDSGKLAVWDPVVKTGEVGLPSVNGIPWKLLHQREISGRPSIVKAGDFDPRTSGDEILFGFKMNDEIRPETDDVFRTTIIKSSITNPDGMNWTDHIAAKDDGNEWLFVESGDLGDGGADEIALLDADGGEVNIFRLADGFQRILGESSSSSPYRAVAFGDFFQGGYEEVIISRNEKYPKISLFYYQYFPGEEPELRYAEDHVEVISPYPRFIFVADVNNSGDDEIFMLRQDSEPRLISRNHGADPMPTLEKGLDGDDGYRVGAGGDLDGDSDDEVIIMRDDRLRVYKNEEVRWEVEEYVVGAETNILRTGDLDGGGSPAFVFSHESISHALKPDTSVQNREYSLTVSGTDDVINFTYEIRNAPPWVSITTDSLQASGSRPARVFASFDATGLTFGTYEAELVFTAMSPTTTLSPFSVPIRLDVYRHRNYLPVTSYHSQPTPFPQLVNGNFDLAGGWQQSTIPANPNHVLVVGENAVERIAAHSAPNLAWLGGTAGVTDNLYQQISLPADYPAVHLSYRYWVESEEETCADDPIQLGVDMSELGIYRVDSQQYVVLEYFTLCTETGTDGWHHRTIPLGSFAGQTVRIHFAATLDDDSGISNLFLDSVKLCDNSSAHPCN